MSGQPTTAELNQLAIDEAQRRHTPNITEMPVRTCKEMMERQTGDPDFYGKCDGDLEVIDVSPAYDDYKWAFVRCMKCRQEIAYRNPRRRQKPEDPKTTKLDWRQRRDIGGNDDELPF